MHRAPLALLCAAALAAPATLYADIGPEAVFTGDVFACNAALFDETLDWFACLADQGAGPEALAFARAFSTMGPNPIEGVLTDFEERGTIDIGIVTMPGLANTNDQAVMLNGPLSITFPGQLYSGDPPDDAGTRRVRAAHPDATPAGRLGIVSHRARPGGVQRFVIGDMVTDGCRACEILGDALTQIEFQDGTFIGATPLGWTDAALADPTSAPAGAELQYLLNLAGYQAGSMDGIAGPQTRRALADFQAEFCLPAAPDLTPEAAEILRSANRSGTAPPCAARAGGALPLSDGVYVTGPDFCAPPDDPFWTTAGDRVLREVIAIAGETLALSESRCTVTGITRQGDAADVALDCLAEGEPMAMTLGMTILTDTRFVLADGRVFTRCAP